MSLARAQAEIDSFEFTLWLADYLIEPWGDDREDRRAAANVLASVASGGGKIDMKSALELVNPWTANGGLPSKAEVARKVRLFNAGIRGMNGKR